MNKRQIDIYINLTCTSQVEYINTLTQRYDVSIRTIQNDIKELNRRLSLAKCKPIIIGEDNSLSISYHEGDASRLYESITLEEYTFEMQERHCVLITVLLLNNSYVTLDSIADFLSYSKATLTNDFTVIKEQLKKKNIIIQSEKFRGIFLCESDEVIVRKLIIDLIMNNTWLMEFIIKELINTELIDIRLKSILSDNQLFCNMVSETEKSSDFFLTNDSKYKAVLCIKLIISRITLGRLVGNEKKNTVIDENDLPMTQVIFKKIKSNFGNIILEDDYRWLNELFLKLEYIELGQLPVSYQTVKLHWSIKNFLNRLSIAFKHDLGNDFLLYRDISNYLHQSLDDKFGQMVNQEYDLVVNSDNNKLKLFYDIVHQNINIIEEISGYKLNEAQMKELTYFIQASILRAENNINDLTYVLVSDKGKGVTSYIYEQLKERLNTSKIDRTISPSLDYYLKNNNPDLIITTEIIGDRGIPMAQISPMLTKEDMKLIVSLIRRVKSNISNIYSKKCSDSKTFNRAKEIILSQQPYGRANRLINGTHSFSYLLPRKNILSDIDAIDWKDAIIKASEILLENGDISINSIKDIISKLETDNRYIIINKKLAIIPLFNIDEHLVDKFSMSLIELEKKINFIDNDCTEGVKYVCCVTIEKKRQYLKAVHFISNMIKEEENI